MVARECNIADVLGLNGIPRRKFLKFCASMTAMLGLPASAAAQVAATLQQKRRPVLVWLELQDCAGNSESMLRASHPSITELVLSFFSWEYHELIMAAAGKQAEAVLNRVVREEAGKYVAIVEGSIPTADPGYCTIGGRSAMEIARQVCGSAAAVIAVGSCAFDGGPQRSSPNPTGAIGIGEALPNVNLVNLSGCPHNPANTAALLVYWLTYGRMPALDAYKRPLFAYGHIIHDQCERRANFDAGRFVERWDDEGAKRGYCLYKMGCKGPQGNFNCPVVRWNEGTSWPVQSGHGCAACASYRFWDTSFPLYQRLPGVPGFGVDITAGKIGGILVAGVATGLGLHGIASAARMHMRPHGEEPRGGPTEIGKGPGLVEREGPPKKP
jgi:hydrogenase small subunit